MPAITWPGVPYPLGARFDGAGVNFAVFSEAATGVDVCLFDAPGDAVPRARLALSERTAHVYHGYVPGLKKGQLYGLRARGPWSPRDGHRFDESKLLVDPYARAIANGVDWRGPLAKHPGADPNERDARDTARVAPKCVVVDGAFDWRGDAPPRVPWADSLIYEAHVKGFTARHPAVPQAIRGTYAGLATDAAIDHLKRLRVTAIELLPVHAKVDDEALVQRGLVNYWGYNTLAFFAPEGAYAASGQRGEQVTEFKEMVRALHRAGIEVLLDVVYNHTCEADEKGPTLSLRGLDNRAYYRLEPSDRSKYEDLTGCGNSVDTRHPAALQLVLDSLRYWVEEMHVDGFRFDLATVLAREPLAFDRFSAFFDVVRQDPSLARVKLVAEPWDVAEGGYQVGGFPAPWAEWNGKYRDAVRRFWSGRPMAAEIGYRLTGSSDLYAASGRAPTASVNFVVAHDGFTLADLTSYAKKHNEANGEQNRDGSDQNDSENHGVEGPTNDPAILEARARKARALVATLLLSQGVPMICAGDEMGRTQRGNNNAYCHDSELTWLDYHLDDAQTAMLEFVTGLSALRAAEPVLRRRSFFSGAKSRSGKAEDVTWLGPDGARLTAEDWAAPTTRALAMRLDGDGIPDPGPRGEVVSGATLLVLLNAGDADVAFTLPKEGRGAAWTVVVDTRTSSVPVPGAPLAGASFTAIAKSVVVLRLTKAPTRTSGPPSRRRTSPPSRRG